jgi:S-adenosylmethionine synthetase
MNGSRHGEDDDSRIGRGTCTSAPTTPNRAMSRKAAAIRRKSGISGLADAGILT